MGKEVDLYFIRDGNKNEIDLLIFQDNKLFPIEIKQTTNPSVSDIKNFDVLDSVKGIQVGDGGVVCLASEILPLKDNNRIIPLWCI